MNRQYDFDTEIDRSATDATKYAELTDKYGRSDLLPLWIADMDFRSPDTVRQAIMDCFDRPVIGYTTAPSSFWDSIVGWLNRRHGFPVTRSDIDFLPGLKKGLGLCINYFTKPGDNVVIQPPVYHSFKSVIEGNGRHTVDNPLVYDGVDYRMDFDNLQKVIAETKPVMMIICNPHNPIGIQWDKESLAKIAEICHRNDIILISDEIYGDLVFGTPHHIPTATVSSEAAEITVSLGAPSKSFNIPGVASAWVAILNPALRDGFFQWLHASEFDTPPSHAIYATQAAYTSAEDWLDQVLDYLAANASYAVGFLHESLPQASVTIPNAGFGLWINLNFTGLSDERLSEVLVNDARLALSDGISFGNEGSGFIRLNFGVPRTVLTRGLNSLVNALKPYC